MRVLFFFLFVLAACFTLTAQNEALAKNYFDQGQFEKALPIYENLHRQNPGRRDYMLSLLATYQQLENYTEAGKLLEKELSRSRNNPTLFVEIGKNYTLQKDTEKAAEFYDAALKAIENQPNIAYSVAIAFERHSLLDYAVAAYEKGMELNPSANYNTQLARIYGEQGNLEKMFNSYLDILDKNAGYINIILRNFSHYITEDPHNEANDILRKALLRKSQSNQDVIYNELLSWLFVKQKEYAKAFIQERAIQRRTLDNINGIMELAVTAMEDKEYAIAEEILEFVIEIADYEQNILDAHKYAMQIAVKTAKKQDYTNVEKRFKDLINQYGGDTQTFTLQIDYNLFLAFYYDKKEQAIVNLREMKNKSWSRHREATLLMTLADILIFDEKFNEALIYYSQIQHKLKNDPIAQEARFKVARASYFKGDFKWAQTQLEVLKTSTSQLIANDAMELSLLISDNSLADSTQTALKQFARADLLLLQKKYTDAIALLDIILEEHQGESIEDEALLKQASAYEITGEYEKAEVNYLKIIEHHKFDILADDAYFRLAELYNHIFQQPEKAKEYYEQIIFNHPDSIYFVEARKQYRSIRGDVVK